MKVGGRCIYYYTLVHIPFRFHKGVASNTKLIYMHLLAFPYILDIELLIRVFRLFCSLLVMNKKIIRLPKYYHVIQLYKLQLLVRDYRKYLCNSYIVLLHHNTPFTACPYFPTFLLKCLFTFLTNTC